MEYLISAFCRCGGRVIFFNKNFLSLDLVDLRDFDMILAQNHEKGESIKVLNGKKIQGERQEVKVSWSYHYREPTLDNTMNIFARYWGPVLSKLIHS